MRLTLKDVASLFGISENTVIRWVDEDNLPAELIGAQLRFNRAELLEWATIRKRDISPFIFHQVDGDPVDSVRVADALERGGIDYNVQGSDKAAVLRAVVAGLPLPQSIDRTALLQLFLARESLGTTALGDGLAIPHPRTPIVFPSAQAAVRLCFLATPQDFQSPDGRPVDILFAIVCPTVHLHLQLLARLAGVLQVASFRAAVRQHAAEATILREMRAAEDSFTHSDGRKAG
jgi:PTS system nitrogen regulatory IIA component